MQQADACALPPPLGEHQNSGAQPQRCVHKVWALAGSAGRRAAACAAGAAAGSHQTAERVGTGGDAQASPQLLRRQPGSIILDKQQRLLLVVRQARPSSRIL